MKPTGSPRVRCSVGASKPIRSAGSPPHERCRSGRRRRLDTSGAPVTWRRCLRSRRVVGGGLCLLLLVIAAGLAPWLWDRDPELQKLGEKLRPPGATYPLGSDQLGRDMLARLLYGARISLAVGLSAVVVSGVVGVTLGLCAGYFGGALDTAVMRLADVQLAIPLVILAIAMMAFLGPSVGNVIVVLAVSRWMIYARTIRGVVLSLAEQPFVVAAHAAGATAGRVIVNHLLPNAWTPIIVVASQQVAQMIILESILSFLGVGVPASTATWGGMIAEGRNYLEVAWWVVGMPSLAISATVLAINFFGDGLRDALDPRLRL
jgi:peptide/nickel transport system permease protein